MKERHSSKSNAQTRTSAEAGTDSVPDALSSVAGSKKAVHGLMIDSIGRTTATHLPPYAFSRLLFHDIVNDSLTMDQAARLLQVTPEDARSESPRWQLIHEDAPLYPLSLLRKQWFRHSPDAGELDPNYVLEPQVMMMDVFSQIVKESFCFHFQFLLDLDTEYHRLLDSGELGTFNESKDHTAWYNMYHYWRGQIETSYVTSNLITLPEHLRNGNWTIADVLDEIGKKWFPGGSLHPEVTLTSRGISHGLSGASLGLYSDSDMIDSDGNARFYFPRFFPDEGAVSATVYPPTTGSTDSTQVVGARVSLGASDNLYHEPAILTPGESSGFTEASVHVDAQIITRDRSLLDSSTYALEPGFLGIHSRVSTITTEELVNDISPPTTPSYSASYAGYTLDFDTSGDAVVASDVNSVFSGLMRQVSLGVTSGRAKPWGGDPTGIVRVIAGNTPFTSANSRGYNLNLVDLLALSRKITRQMDSDLSEYVLPAFGLDSGSGLLTRCKGMSAREYDELYNLYESGFAFNENPMRFFTLAHAGPVDTQVSRNDDLKIGDVRLDSEMRTADGSFQAVSIAERYWMPPAITGTEAANNLGYLYPVSDFDATAASTLNVGALLSSGVVDTGLASRLIGNVNSMLTKAEKPVILPAGVTSADGLYASAAPGTEMDVLVEMILSSLGSKPEFGLGRNGFTDWQSDGAGATPAYGPNGDVEASLTRSERYFAQTTLAGLVAGGHPSSSAPAANGVMASILMEEGAIGGLDSFTDVVDSSTWDETFANVGRLGTKSSPLVHNPDHIYYVDDDSLELDAGDTYWAVGTPVLNTIVETGPTSKMYATTSRMDADGMRQPAPTLQMTAHLAMANSKILGGRKTMKFGLTGKTVFANTHQYAVSGTAPTYNDPDYVPTGDPAKWLNDQNIQEAWDRYGSATAATSATMGAVNAGIAGGYNGLLKFMNPLKASHSQADTDMTLRIDGSSPLMLKGAFNSTPQFNQAMGVTVGSWMDASGAPQGVNAEMPVAWKDYVRMPSAYSSYAGVTAVAGHGMLNTGAGNQKLLQDILQYHMLNYAQSASPEGDTDVAALAITGASHQAATTLKAGNTLTRVSYLGANWYTEDVSVDVTVKYAFDSAGGAADFISTTITDGSAGATLADGSTPLGFDLANSWNTAPTPVVAGDTSYFELTTPVVFEVLWRESVNENSVFATARDTLDGKWTAFGSGISKAVSATADTAHETIVSVKTVKTWAEHYADGSAWTSNTDIASGEHTTSMATYLPWYAVKENIDRGHLSTVGGKTIVSYTRACEFDLSNSDVGARKGILTDVEVTSSSIASSNAEALEWMADGRHSDSNLSDTTSGQNEAQALLSPYVGVNNGAPQAGSLGWGSGYGWGTYGTTRPIMASTSGSGNIERAGFTVNGFSTLAQQVRPGLNQAFWVANQDSSQLIGPHSVNVVYDTPDVHAAKVPIPDTSLHGTNPYVAYDGNTWVGLKRFGLFLAMPAFTRNSCMFVYPDRPEERMVYRPHRTITDAAVRTEQRQFLVPTHDLLSVEAGWFGLPYYGESRPFLMDTLLFVAGVKDQYLLEGTRAKTRLVDSADRGRLTFSKVSVMDPSGLGHTTIPAVQQFNAAVPGLSRAYPVGGAGKTVWSREFIRELQLGRQFQRL